MRNLMILLILTAFANICKGQTCCSAGASMGSNLDVDHSQGKGINFQLGYEFNDVNALFDQNVSLKNDPRSRVGHSAELKLDYVFNQHWSVSLISPFLIQSRRTFSEKQLATGLGDMTLAVSHSRLLQKNIRLAATLALELPTGAQFLRSIDGIILSPDLQSGSGTVDYLAKVSLSKQHFLKSFLTAEAGISYRRNSTNQHFGDREKENGRMFKFGDELIVESIFTYQITKEKYFLYPSVGLQFRQTSANEEQGSIAPNSGGYWLNLPLSIGIKPSEKFAIRFLGMIPLYRDLEGLQITTRFRTGVQVSYYLGLDKNVEPNFDKIILQQ